VLAQVLGILLRDIV